MSCHCVRLVMAHGQYAVWHIWVIHQVRSFDLTQTQIFKLTFRGHGAYVLMRLHEKKNNDLSPFALSFLVQVLCKNVDRTKINFFL